MAYDLEDALDRYDEAAALYRQRVEEYRADGSALGSPEWSRKLDASLARSAAFKEALRHGLGLEPRKDS